MIALPSRHSRPPRLALGYGLLLLAGGRLPPLEGEAPVLVRTSARHSHRQAIVERIRPTTPALVQSEIVPWIRIRAPTTI